jgi:uncharacterized protein YyaL (SSP411 family)
MLAGDLWDAVEGGFFRYAHAADWTQPQTEKLLAVQAGLLRAFATAAHVQKNVQWRHTAEQLVDWVDRTLRLPDGLWSASQSAAPDYYASSDRKSPPAIDLVLYTSANAQWIRALAEAGARWQQQAWVANAEQALLLLHERMAAPNDLYFHYCEPDGSPQLPYLLIDVVEVARAFVAVAQATGRADLLVRARTSLAAIERAFWADEGGFYDRTRTAHDVGVLRYRDRPFDGNAETARLLIELVLATGERSYRALAERTLALLSPAAGRYGVGGSGFALAVHEFFEPPVQVFIVGEGSLATELRQAALTLPLAARRVWPLPAGGRVGTQHFALHASPVAYLIGPRAGTIAVADPTRLADAASALS